MNKNKTQQGFTLIELLLVISILAILAVSVFVALNPVKRMADARNSKRWSDSSEILTAIHQYIVDNNGSLPSGVTTSPKQLGTCSTGGASPCTGAATACLDLSTTLAKYLKTIPVDSVGTSTATGYSVMSDANGIVSVVACGAENGVNIEVSR